MQPRFPNDTHERMRKHRAVLRGTGLSYAVSVVGTAQIVEAMLEQTLPIGKDAGHELECIVHGVNYG